MKRSAFVTTLAIVLSGCASLVHTSSDYRQPGADKFSVADVSGKAIVLLDAEAGWNDKSTMLVGYAALIPGKTQQQLYEAKPWEFATYPGAVIPFYAGDKPYGLHAYLLRPGRYAVVRCIWGAPELDYCPANYWTHKGTPVGIAFFEVSAGEVINTGKLQVTRSKKGFGEPSAFDVTILDNQAEVTAYMKANLPSFADKLVYRPLRFTK